jgi:Abortive infection C-terminus
VTELADGVERFQHILLAFSTGGTAEADEYLKLRELVLNHPLTRDIAPRFLRTCRTLPEFWQFIKNKFNHYHERRTFLWDEFRPLFERIEGMKSTPADASVAERLERFDAESVHQIWGKAMERRENDPEGAVTLARTLLETVCKHILDGAGIAYQPTDDLPTLYHAASKELNIAPSQHSEKTFKQILGGVTSVVQGLGSLRNSLSDAHGRGKQAVKPAPRHAELAVNLAGATAVFLIATHEAMKPKANASETVFVLPHNSGNLTLPQ